jgi:hypothetical protein
MDQAALDQIKANFRDIKVSIAVVEYNLKTTIKHSENLYMNMKRIDSKDQGKASYHWLKAVDSWIDLVTHGSKIHSLKVIKWGKF